MTRHNPLVDRLRGVKPQGLTEYSCLASVTLLCPGAQMGTALVSASGCGASVVGVKLKEQSKVTDSDIFRVLLKGGRDISEKYQKLNEGRKVEGLQ